MKKIYCQIIFALLFISLCFGQDVIQKGKSFYISNTLVVKVKDNTAPIRKRLGKSLPDFKIKETTQLFPNSSRLNKGEESLSRIYLLKYDSPESPAEMAAKISKQSNIEWAEPKFVQRVTFSPNDSLFVLGRQENLKRIHADSAWSITKGDSSVVIGIVDTGVDWEHPDLLANRWYYQDHLVGTDLGGNNGTQDNDPREDYSATNKYHGTHVAGIACAVTNNRKGIASIGFNSSFFPVKASRNDERDSDGYPFIYYGYEGIKYAADNGARVINCSWGGSDYSRLGQETIDYAVSKGALVVAAAGNDYKLTDFYPASFDGVLSVGWSETLSDVVAGNYGRTVDVYAPGMSILSTWPMSPTDSLYNRISGSSMSTPLVSGLAALLFSTSHNYTALQVAEQIRATSDNIEQSNNIANQKYLLGRGRINAFRALKDTNATSIRATDIKFIDEGNGNGMLESGETVSVEITFTNFLKLVSGVYVQLVNSDSVVTLLGGNNFYAGAVNTLDTVSNTTNKFQFHINQNAPLNHDLNLLLKYFINGNEVDFQWIKAKLNATYITHDIGKINTSITSKGALGFNDFPGNTEGEGFKFNGGNNLLFEGAFMYGIQPNRVMDVARVYDYQDTDFLTVTPVKTILNDGTTQHSVAVFNDDGGAADKLSIETTFHAYTYANAPDDNYILLIAEMKNTTMQDINSMHAGFYFDWDLPEDDPDIDSTAYDTTDNFGYAFCADKNIVSTIVGAALISSDKYGYYPIGNRDTTGSIIFKDGFSDFEKMTTLNNGIVKNKIGPTDISFVISGGPFNIAAQQSIKVAFSIAAGETLDEVRNAIKQSRNKYLVTSVEDDHKILPNSFKLFQNYPNPFNPSTVISWQITIAAHVTLKVYDLLGREIATLVDDYKQPGIYNSQFSILNSQLPSGIYFYRLIAGNNTQTKKMILLK